MPPRRAAPLLLLACSLLLLAAPHAAAGPSQPSYPGDDAPVEDLIRFYNDLQQYLNVVTRHRYGRRSSSQALCEEPMGAAGC
ncbi:pancreatic hormone-like [Tympanuchus pallidicinctus]|uniref:pancreatic hormone-like n=1 Tax=Tympanuchus pallidicinctus TaxID=109042 RepID=UPI00228745A0|nr:pancreatic hormone-like [Tympanuchus pallidicinctus]